MIVGAPDRIEGYRYINQDLEDLHLTYKPILFGDFNQFCVRQAGELRLVRLVERYGELDQIAFAVIGRFDSNKSISHKENYMLAN